MARKGGDPSPAKQRAAFVFFGVGLGLLLLYVFGPIVWGPTFQGQILQTPALGLIGVGVVVLVGVNLPALDWGGIIARVLAALIDGGKAKGGSG